MQFIPRDQSVVVYTSQAECATAVAKNGASNNKNGKRAYPESLLSINTGQVVRLNNAIRAKKAASTPVAAASTPVAADVNPECDECFGPSVEPMSSWLGTYCERYGCRTLEKKLKFCNDCLTTRTSTDWCPAHLPWS
jgi:hypothetical protein